MAPLGQEPHFGGNILLDTQLLCLEVLILVIDGAFDSTSDCCIFAGLLFTSGLLYLSFTAKDYTWFATTS